ncbi:GntR family transcriptional regulator [Citricoccus sp. NPDC055426]|uniref:GntR family transcriptional regulator n=1 Tax=Citricoccus sp. NPDC055426 TaxID=3155536 RepID=UPI0034400DE4
MNVSEPLLSDLDAQTGGQSLRNQVRSLLRSWIITGRLEAGSRVRESDVAEELGISRVPVREAIAMLEGEGLLTSMSRRGGVVVTELKTKDIEDFFDIRERLEGLAARLAARRAQPGDIRRLRWYIAEARAASEEGREEDFSAANLDFHTSITRMADNSTLASMLEVVGVHLRWNTVPNRDHEQILGDHEQIAEAIAAGDEDAAERLTLKDIHGIRGKVVPGLEEL